MKRGGGNWLGRRGSIRGSIYVAACGLSVSCALLTTPAGWVCHWRMAFELTEEAEETVTEALETEAEAEEAEAEAEARGER